MGVALVVTDGKWLRKSRCDARLYFVSVGVLNRWNSLPQSAVQVDSVNGFKNQLKKLRTHQMDFFVDVAKSNGCWSERLDWMSGDIYRLNSGAAAPGEIPDEIDRLFALLISQHIPRWRLTQRRHGFRWSDNWHNILMFLHVTDSDDRRSKVRLCNLSLY